MSGCRCQDPVVFGCHCSAGRPPGAKRAQAPWYMEPAYRIARNRGRYDDIVTLMIGQGEVRLDLYTFDRLPVGTEMTCHTACPSCLQRNVVDLTIVLEAAPVGSFALAGNVLKFPVRRAVRYTCTSCGASGKAVPK